MRQGQFHHFINEFNYLYQQTKTVSLPPSLSPYHLLYPTVLFPTMTFYPQAKVIIEQGHSKLKTKCDRSEDRKNNIKIAHLVSSSLRKESGVQRIMSIVCQHTYNPCSCAKKNYSKGSVKQTHSTNRSNLLHSYDRKSKQETVGHRRCQ